MSDVKALFDFECFICQQIVKYGEPIAMETKVEEWVHLDCAKGAFK